MYYEGFRKLKELEALFIDKTNRWQIKQDSKKKGADLFYEQCYCSETGFPMIRIVSFTDHDALESARAYSDSSIRKQYDRNINEFYLTEKLGGNLFVAYQSTNRIVTVGPRDCYHYVLQKVDMDGTITCIFWDKNMPENQGHVRMSLPIGGIRFTPLHNDPRGKTQVTYLIKVNLGGVIPTWIQSQALGWTAGGQLVYKQLIAKYLQQNPASTTQSNPIIEQQKHLY